MTTASNAAALTQQLLVALAIVSIVGMMSPRTDFFWLGVLAICLMYTVWP